MSKSTISTFQLFEMFPDQETARRATEIEIAAEMDRRGSVIECLEQKIARSDSIMKDIRRLLVRCHDRIHSLPRTSDTELAASIEQLLGRIASELGAPRNG